MSFSRFNTRAAYGGGQPANPTLNDLLLSPASATVNVAYSGAIIGRTLGSAIVATSSDGATLTVVGDMVNGTFTTLGAKTITLTETLAGATNTPHVSTPTLTVNSAYDTDAAAYFAAMTVQPDATRKGLINALIVGLKADGVWATLDWLVLMAAHHEQAGRVNAKTPSKIATNTGMTHTVDRGFVGTGSAPAYLDTGEAVTAAGNNAANGNVAIGAYVNLGGSTANNGTHYYVGDQFAVSGAYLGRGAVDASLRGALQQNGQEIISGDNSSSGHRVVVRNGNGGGAEFYLDGASLGTGVNAGTGAVLGTNLLLGQVSNALYHSDRVAACHSGSQITPTRVLALRTRLNTYLTAIGAN